MNTTTTTVSAPPPPTRTPGGGESAARRAGGLTPAVVRATVAVVAAAVLLSGCRTYGRYDAQEKMLPEMRQSVQLFASDLERARADLDLLRQAAQSDSALRVVAEEYDRAVERHEEILDENQQLVDRFEENLPDYRRMHRTLGATLSEHRAARNRYRSLLKAVRYPSVTQRMAPGADSARAQRRALPDSLPQARDEAYTEGRYFVAPIFYERLQSTTGEMTMRQALAERRQRRSQQGRPQRRGGASEGEQRRGLLEPTSGSAASDTADGEAAPPP